MTLRFSIINVCLDLKVYLSKNNYSYFEFKYTFNLLTETKHIKS